MNDRTRERAGIAVVAVLATDALVHVYWMTGSTWPAGDAEALSLAVLNVVLPFTPRGLLLPLGLLLAASTTILLAVGRPARLSGRLPVVVTRLGGRLVAAGLLVRAVAGLVWALGIGASPATPFYWLNLLAYTPVCLALFAGAVIATGPYRANRPASRGTHGR
ncbi:MULTISPECIES: DUF3995 domain-containing protein [Nonomuraea]|uniref:DUF3995 domain-containing protein n=1 Tax=Nonomuraea mangrovi TaxID=2316207 RepID=A0ABW4T8Z1_9ACTN